MAQELRVDITVDDKGSMVVKRFGQSAEKSMAKVERSAKAARKSALKLKLAFAGLTATGGYLFTKFTGITDQYTQLDNRLKLVTGSTEQLDRVSAALYDTAQDTFTSYADTVELYAGVARATSELTDEYGRQLLTEQELVAFTGDLNRAMLVSGASQEAAANATRQMIQALEGGVVRAEEYNSILENTPRILKAVASGMGVSMGELRQQMLAGELTAQRFVEAFQEGAKDIAAEFDSTERTARQAMTTLGNTLRDIIDDADDTKGATAGITKAIIELRDTIEKNRKSILALFTGMIDAGGRVVEVTGDIIDRVRLLSGWAAGVISLDDALFGDADTMFAGIDSGLQIIERRIADTSGQIAMLELSMRGLQNAPANSRLGKRYAEWSAEVERLRGELQRLETQRNALIKQEQKAQQIGEELAKTSDTQVAVTVDLATETETAEKAIKKTTKETVNYDNALQDAFGSVDRFSQSLSDLDKTTHAYYAELGKKVPVDSWLLKAQDAPEVAARAMAALEEQTEQSAFVFQEQWDNAFENFQSYLSDALMNWQWSWDSMLDIAKRALADIVSAFVTSGLRELVGSIFADAEGISISGLTGGGPASGIASTVAGTIANALGLPSIKDIGASVAAALGIGGGSATAGLTAGTQLALLEGTYGPAAAAASGGAASGGIGAGLGAAAPWAAGAAGIAAMFSLGGVFGRGEKVPWVDRLTQTGTTPSSLAEAGLTDQITLISNAMRDNLTPALHGAESIALDAANGLLVTGNTIATTVGNWEQGTERVVKSTRQTIYAFDAASGRWVETGVSMDYLAEKFETLTATTDMSDEATARMIATQAGYPALADEIILATRGQEEAATLMTRSMTVLSAQTGLNNTDVVALTEKMNLLSESTGLTTEEIVAQTAEQYNLTEQTDLLRRAYESQKGPTEELTSMMGDLTREAGLSESQISGLIGEMFEWQSATGRSTSEIARQIAEQHKVPGAVDALIAAYEAQYETVEGLAGAMTSMEAAIRRASEVARTTDWTPTARPASAETSYAIGTDYVPRTGLYQLHQGEAVIPAKYNRGGLDSESRQLLGVIAVASKQQLKILKRFEYLGIPQSTRQAVA
jgi:tape measure domain-containing protein